MTQIAEVKSQEPTQPPSKSWRFTREILAILFWIYLLLTLFVVEPLSCLVNIYAPEIGVLVYYRFFAFLVLCSILWILLGNSCAFQLLTWIIFYPFVWLFYRVPKFLLPRWAILIAFFPAIYQIGATFKSTFIAYSFVMFAGLCVFLFPIKEILIPCMVIFAAFFLRHLITSLSHAYSASAFSGLASIVRKASKFILKAISGKIVTSSAQTELEALRELTPLDESVCESAKGKSLNSEEAKKQKLISFYACNWFFKYVAYKLHDVARSRIPELYLLLSWIYTALLCTIVFSLEYYSLYRIDASSFTNVSGPPFLSFLGLSISRLTVSGISSVSPFTSSAILLSYVHACIQVFIFIASIFSIFTTKREKHNADIAAFVDELKKISEAVEEQLLEIYEHTISSVEVILFVSDKKMINWMRRSVGEEELEILNEENKLDESKVSKSVNSIADLETRPNVAVSRND